MDHNSKDTRAMDTQATALSPTLSARSPWAPRARPGLGSELLFGALEEQNGGYLLAVGIDRLGFFNETLGTAVTDDLIAGTGRRLRHLLGSTAAVQRVGGDVFAVVVPGAPPSEMPAIAAHILNSFQDAPMSAGKGLVRVSVSIGGAPHEQGVDEALLLSRAESALRTAKDAGRGRFAPYTATRAQTEAYGHMIATGDAFLRALKSRRLGLAFQKVVDSRTGRVSFHECLIRLVGENGRVHRAAEFMPAVEELGLVRMLDQAAIAMVIRELAAFPDLVLSANVSHDSLADMTWIRGVVSALRDRPDVARRLVVEITESAVMRDPAQTQRLVRTLKDLGCRVALDDFGAGYTAFTQIQNLQVDIVKIDQSFVRRMREEGGHLFIRALQTLADGIAVETVGEGAETAEEAATLARDGVRHIQGYVHGMPAMERLWLPPGHVHRRFMDGIAA
ncbi:MAG TPA: hypothetical protein DDX54_04060 [Rhodospirillaceae bacterium]|jgi:diguanylate cyclase (GGDEF)-like protein|nr:phosphodiesterase [Alphaproteobacteria bacterium]HBH26559.1 hypothetical protein [Rhodospirillaceae bacterium]